MRNFLCLHLPLYVIHCDEALYWRNIGAQENIGAANVFVVSVFFQTIYENAEK